MNTSKIILFFCFCLHSFCSETERDSLCKYKKQNMFVHFENVVFFCLYLLPFATEETGYFSFKMKAKILFILSITNTDNKHAVNFTAYLDDLPEQSSPAKGTQDILTFFLDVFHIFCFFFFRMSSHPRAIPKCRSNQQTPSGPGDTKSSGEFGGGRASQ